MAQWSTLDYSDISYRLTGGDGAESAGENGCGKKSRHSFRVSQVFDDEIKHHLIVARNFTGRFQVAAGKCRVQDQTAHAGHHVHDSDACMKQKNVGMLEHVGSQYFGGR